MTIGFVFGAGASYGSLDCKPSTPPLGNDLFKAMRDGGFLSFVNEECAEKFSDFEVGMDFFYKNHSGFVVRFLQEMSLFFLKYDLGDENLYFKIAEQLARSKKRAVFMTTNYDLLLEKSFERAGLDYSYSFGDSPDQVSLLKIHGSCNFIPQCTFTGIAFQFSPDWRGPAIRSNFRAELDLRKVMKFCMSSSIAPAIAMYSPDKTRLFDGVFVESQYSSWVESLSHCESIFVVGLRVHLVDRHIWELLAVTTAKIYYVGSQKEVFEKWASENGRSGDVAISGRFEGAIEEIFNAIHGK
jgi:hypothetical protein